MQSHIGKSIRTSDIIGKNVFLLDTTIASCIGAKSILSDLNDLLKATNEIFDGIIVNPGPMEHLSLQLSGKNRASPLVRVDWTNAYRDDTFCLPVSDIKRVEISSAEDVMNLGASAGVATLLMGFDDTFEAENIQSISQFIRTSYPLSLPVFVDIRPMGPGVSDVNFEETIKLGVSFMLEAGAEAIIVPDCSEEILTLISSWSRIPVIVRMDNSMSKNEINKKLGLGIKGLLFCEQTVNNYHDVKESLQNNLI